MEEWNEGTAEQYLCRMVNQQRQSHEAEMIRISKHYLKNGDTCMDKISYTVISEVTVIWLTKC